MKKILIFSMVLMLAVPMMIMNGSSDEREPYAFFDGVPEMEGFFTENLGQWDDAIDHMSDAPFGHIALSDGGMFYDMVSGEDGGHVLRLTFQGSSGTHWAGSREMDHRSNYFLGNDPARWASSVRNFDMVETDDLWDGIALRYMISSDGPKYEYHLSPGSDVSDIRVSVEGQSRLAVIDDALVMEVEGMGSIIDDGLLIYDTTGKVLEGSFVLHDEHTYGFEVQDWDGNYPLVIDPILNSTYLGGNSHDEGMGVFYQGDNVYVSSTAMSTNFPTTPGAYSVSNAGGSDIVITKMDRYLSKLIFSTYLGGSGGEVPWGMVVDSSGDAYVTGYTASSNFPTSSGAIRSTYAGSTDIYVSKIASNGTKLGFSTYYGGSSSDWGISLDIDGSGNIYVAGHTKSEDFPCSDDAFIKDFSEFSTDGMVLKIDPTGTKMLYSTYINGKGGISYCTDIDVDGSGYAYVTGKTTSENFTVTNGSLDTNYSGSTDIFALKLLPNGTDVEWSTFIGGTGYEVGDRIHLLSNGDLFIGGTAASTDLPISDDAFQQNLSGSSDILLMRLNASGDQLKFMTYLGGGSFETLEDLLEDSEGHLYLTGGTRSSDFPMSPDAYDSTHGSTNGYDIYLSRLSGNGTRLLYSTFIGTTSHEYGNSLSIDGNDVIYITGRTESAAFPTTSGAYDTTQNGMGDVYVTRFSTKDVPGKPLNLVGDLSLGQIDLEWDLPLKDGGEPILGYKIIRSDDGGPDQLIAEDVTGLGFTDDTFKFGSTYSYQVLAFNRIGTSLPSATIIVKDEVAPIIGLDMTPTSASPLEEITFKTRATDDLWLDKVEIEFRYGEGKVITEEMMAPGGADFQLDHNVADTALDIHYRFTASDLYGNENVSEWSVLDISGDPRPFFGIDSSDETAFTGDPFRADIEVFDNVEVESCWVGYQFIGSYAKNRTMEYEGDGRWSFEIDVPSDSLSSLEYTFHAVDAYGNWRTSDKRTVEITDNDAPTIEDDSTPGSCVAGEGLMFMVKVNDNIKVEDVNVQIEYDDGSTIGISLDPHIGGYFMKDHETRSDSTGLLYTISVTDREGNMISGDQKSVELTDDIPPEFIDFSIPGKVSTGSVAILGLNATDNIEIDLLQAHYRFGDTGMEMSTGMTSSDDGRFSCSIEVPSDRTDDLFVVFSMEDGSGHTAESEEFTIEVVDDIAPTIDPVDDISAVEGDLITISISVDDNVGISRVVWSGMDVQNGALSWTGQLAPGHYNITVTVKDPSGGHASESFSIDVAPGSADSDNDGLPDDYEIDHHMDPGDPSDALLDNDGDGLSALTEYTLGTDPSKVDSDGDLILDGWEHEHGLDPMVDNSLTDSDNDGRNDRMEHLQSTDPLIQDKAPAKEGEESSSLWVVFLVIDLLVLLIVIVLAVILMLKKGSKKEAEPLPVVQNDVPAPVQEKDDLDRLFDNAVSSTGAANDLTDGQIELK